MGLYTPTIFGGNSYLSLFYDRGAIKDPSHTATSKGLSQAINRGPIRKFLPKYANVYVTIQSHGLSAGARTHYVTAYGVRNGLREYLHASLGKTFPENTVSIRHQKKACERSGPLLLSTRVLQEVRSSITAACGVENKWYQAFSGRQPGLLQFVR